MKIRDAKIKDANRLDELLTELIHDETQYDHNLNNNCVITENYISRIGLEGHKLLVAEIDNKIIGYLYGFIYQIPNIWNEPVAILDALFIEEKYRRNGYASMLIEEFKVFAKENGACRIELKVVTNNKCALKLYEKHNFEETKKYMYLEI